MKHKYDTMFEDKETIISFCECHIGDWAEVYTTDKNVMKRYEKFCREHPDYGKVIKDDAYSMTFSVYPKSASLYPRAPRVRVLTEEQRNELSEHMRNLRKKQDK